MRKLIALACLILGALPASATFLTYAQWSALPSRDRTLYMAGAFDELISEATGTLALKLVRHYSECVASAQMSDGQLADNVLSFAATQPQLQTSTVPEALVAYLGKACGLVSAN